MATIVSRSEGTQRRSTPAIFKSGIFLDRAGDACFWHDLRSITDRGLTERRTINGCA
jgi:hypothetical protein